MKLETPSYSASIIANSYSHLYNIFSLPCSSESYIPNKRLNKLLSSFTELSNEDELVLCVESKLRKLPSVDTWNPVEDGSETKLVAPVLSYYLNTILKVSNRSTSYIPTLSFSNLTIPIFLARNSKPEPRICWNQRVLIASEAKGIECSQYPGLVQGFQVGGDSAIYLNSFIAIEDSVVPVILAYGHFFQIFGVYLLPTNFPVMVELSEPISYLTLTGRLILSRWAVVLNSFFYDTIQLLDQNPRNNVKKSVSLSNDLFFKPIVNNLQNSESKQGISCLRSCVELVMNAYKCLSKIKNSSKYIIFPIGLIAYPSDKFDELFFNNIKSQLITSFKQKFPMKLSKIKEGCPIIVFHKLNTEWKNDKPPPAFRASYLRCVVNAVGILNRAKIAHLDLRATNILWREVSEENVKIQIIDFEDSLPFGIYFQPYQAIQNDRRYPFYQQANQVKINCSHNNWFVVSICKWIESECSSFDNFMREIDDQQYATIQRESSLEESQNGNESEN